MDRLALPLSALPPAHRGLRLVDGGAEICVFSRHGERIWFCLFDESGEREVSRWRLCGRNEDLHHGFVPAVRPGARYGLRADGPWQPWQGHRFDPEKLLVDPYATRIDRPFRHAPELCLPRERAIDTAPFAPRAIVECVDGPPRRAQSCGKPHFIYEIAVKAFTKLHPDVPIEQRGTLAGLTHPKIFEHLLRLGVSHVELMPIAAWIDERRLPALGLSNAWGYNPVCFMAPDPRLAPHGLVELRRLVDGLRAAGIGVILDVVFNHTGEGDAEGATLSLRGLDNAVYYRHADADPGVFVNDSGCGNTLACDSDAVIALVMATLRHYVRHAGVDGFRFDLATILGRGANGFDAAAPLLKAIETDRELAQKILIAEPWDIGPGGYRLGAFSARWYEWNDRYRDDVRRFWRGDLEAAGDFATRLAGSSDIFQRSGRTPSASINFIAAHDGFTLRDLVSYEQRHNHANGEDNRDGHGENYSWNCGCEGDARQADVMARRKRDLRALLATLFLSRGTPMLTAGDEFGRTQRGNNNAYAQDNETIWLDWRRADEGLINFVATLSALRRQLNDFLDDAFLDDEGRARDPIARWLDAGGQSMSPGAWREADVFALFLEKMAPARPRACLLAFNRVATACNLRLPALSANDNWRCLLASRPMMEREAIIDQPCFQVSGRSVAVLIAVQRSG